MAELPHPASCSVTSKAEPCRVSSFVTSPELANAQVGLRASTFPSHSLVCLPHQGPTPQMQALTGMFSFKGQYCCALSFSSFFRASLKVSRMIVVFFFFKSNSPDFFSNLKTSQRTRKSQKSSVCTLWSLSEAGMFNLAISSLILSYCDLVTDFHSIVSYSANALLVILV